MKRPSQYFRAGAGAVIADAEGRVLIFERRDIPGAWQFPQGGIESGEDPIDAVIREIREETGIQRGALRLIRRYPEPLVYELPKYARSVKTGMGQVQYWFLFRLKKTATVHMPSNSAFRATTSVAFSTAVGRAVPFKRPVYRKLIDIFGPSVTRK